MDQMQQHPSRYTAQMINMLQYTQIQKNVEFSFVHFRSTIFLIVWLNYKKI